MNTNYLKNILGASAVLRKSDNFWSSEYPFSISARHWMELLHLGIWIIQEVGKSGGKPKKIKIESVKKDLQCWSGERRALSP